MTKLRLENLAHSYKANPSGPQDYALKELLRKNKQKRLLDLQGKINWTGDLKEMRKGRP